MMWFKRDRVPDKVENGLNKLRRKKPILKPTRESSERETSTESDKERRRYSDILDMKVSMERRDESDESLYESADCQSDVISASDDALPRLGKTPTMSKESLKLAITDEEGETKTKKGHRKTMSLSNPLEIVKTLGDECFNFLRRKKTPTSMKPVEDVMEVDGTATADDILKTKLFLEEEKRFASISKVVPIETDSDDEIPVKKVEHRRRLSRQTSRSKSKVRGKSQSVKVNTLRKSHSGTLKKAKKKSVKAPLNRSRQASIAEPSLIVKKKNSDAYKQNSWLFSGTTGESRREGSTEEQSTPDLDNDASENNAKEVPEKEHNWRGASATSRGVNRAESCRERDAPRRGKHRNASDPNRLTAHPNHDLEPGAATAPSGSSSNSSLSSKSNESNTAATEQQDWSEEEEPLASQWSDSLPPGVRDTIVLCARLRKRQEVIHELIVSEGSHVRWLKVLGGDFLKPLERQPSLLPTEELKALFPNLPSVKERHVRLYSELRAVRNEAPNHVVQIRPIADALLNTLGEAGYASCLSHFCRGQRMALDALRERRRKNKDLHQFLAGREQLPRCGRLQLRDLLACVWQRLTKYQLLLEGILKTVTEDQSEEDAESEEDIAQLRKALQTAKEVLHSVDMAIRTAENEHRLKTIQSKLEVRVPVGPEWEELRRLELTQHSLRMEGELLVRTDTKKMSVLALMLEDSLVLLQREAERFLLKPIAQPSQNTLLSPLIKWDKVLFRPNAAMRNTFFLMNINGIQMHELSANTAAEYSTWVRLIQESRLAETKPTLTSSHQHTRSTDDSGINVSRNPSDASEKSTSSAPPDDTCDSDRENRENKEKDVGEKETRDRASVEPEREKASVEREDKTERMNRSVSVDKDDGEEKHRRRATVGRITTHVDPEDSCGLVDGGNITIRPPIQGVPTAQRVLSHTERLRRLDEAISRALQAKSAVVAEILGVPADSFSHMAELAVADTLGHVDLCADLRPHEMSVEGEPDVHQLLLAAQAQANQLTEALSGALSVNEASVVRARSGRCDSCKNRTLRPSTYAHNNDSMDNSTLISDDPVGDMSRVSDADASHATQSFDTSYEMLNDVDNELRERTVENAFAEEIRSSSASQLASSLVGISCGLQASLGRLVALLPAIDTNRQELRASLAATRERVEKLAYDRKISEEMSFPNENVAHSIQDQPSNGG
ncbi:unnamed protein product [Leptosia nina]|uniref:DH domain-containing protein n=1 Tax=Leptosia nina TaxID=320188 RepID=A0AAV1JL72_9NEOP